MGEMTLNAARISQTTAIGAGVLLACSLSAHALTLGRFQVQSAMGEPLRAEVEVTQFTPNELRGLQAQLASPASFRQAGMEYNAALNGLVARVEQRNDGRPFIVLNGRNPVQDSFIDLILEAQWSTGRAVKNYALLLNSASPVTGSRPSAAPTPSEVINAPTALARTAPLNAAPASGNGSLTPSSIEVNANQVPVYRYDAIKAAPAPAPLASAVPVAPASAAVRDNLQVDHNSLTVNPGDTASNLIAGHLPTQVSLDQMLLALVRANPHAFIEGNVNLIRAGSVLRMPSQGEATQISRAEARQTVMAHNRDFAAYARRVAESPLLVGAAQSREMSGTVTTQTEDAAPARAKQDKLTLSKTQVGDSQAEAQLAAQREAQDAADQLSELNKNMQDLQALAKDGKPDTTALTPTTTLPAAVSDGTSWMTQLHQNKSIWAWMIGALLALVALVLWSRKQDSKANEVFAPSYDDVPDTATPPVSIPPQMAEIDLDLNSPPTDHPAMASMSSAAKQATEESKLNLASELLASGDKELARTLILSVASTANADLRSRAQQMLGQIA
jgi:pilus assembly protein FimV